MAAAARPRQFDSKSTTILDGFWSVVIRNGRLSRTPIPHVIWPSKSPVRTSSRTDSASGWILFGPV